MHPQCSVCRHPRVTAIDTDLLSGAVPVAALAARHGLSSSALYRHRAHLRARLAQARELAHSLVLTELMMIRVAALDRARNLLEQTKAENPSQALTALGLISRLTAAIARDARELGDPVLYHLLTSGAGTGSASVLPSNPDLLKDLRAHLPGVVQSPCPAGGDLPDAGDLPAAENDGENLLPGTWPAPEADLTTGIDTMNGELSPASGGGHQVGTRWELGGNGAGIGWESGGDLPNAAGGAPEGVILPTLGQGREAELQARPAELRGAPTPDRTGTPAPPLPAGPNPKTGKKTKKKGKSKR